MALPINAQPTFSMTIPSTGKSVRFRPFVVKEEKALLIAQQSEDPKVMVDTLKNVFTSVIQDKFDVDSLAIFDIEYMFLQIRGKSVGETIDLLFQCDDDHGEQKGGGLRLFPDLYQKQTKRDQIPTHVKQMAKSSSPCH